MGVGHRAWCMGVGHRAWCMGVGHRAWCIGMGWREEGRREVGLSADLVTI